MELNLWHSLPLLSVVLSWQLLKLQQPEFAMILQPSFFHGSLVVNSGLNEHLLFAASKLLPYYMHVMDFFPHHPITTIFFCKITNFLVIHFLKGTYKFCWCINEICSIDLIVLTIPLCLMKRLKLKMNKSVLVEWTTSPYFLTSFQLFFATNGSEISTPYVTGGSVHILSFGKSAIFCCWSFHLIWYISQSLIAPMNCSLWSKNQKILFGWWWYLDQHVWHHRTVNSVVLQDFGNKVGYWISSDMSHFPILPQTFNIPSWSKNGSNFRNWWFQRIPIM